MSTVIISAANTLSNLLNSFFAHQSMKVTQKFKTERASIYAGTIDNSTQILNSVANSYLEYRKVLEEEKTKRQAIETWEKEAIAKIELQKELFITVLSRSFDERDRVFTSFFKVVDSALETGDNQKLALALASITTIAKTSPLNELVSYSSFQAKLDDPNHQWEF